jgi:2,5-diketo-D-gluconate reductase A
MGPAMSILRSTECDAGVSRCRLDGGWPDSAYEGDRSVTSSPIITLNNGVRIPQLGFGVWRVPNAASIPAVAKALEVGYRHIDTAAMYRNEEGVGEAIRASGVAREEVFVTTKIWPSDFGREAALPAVEASLKRLDLEYVDLLLLHWPAPGRDLYVETWRELERLADDNRVRAIGVSNFHAHHLRRLVDETDTVPVLNQVELHPTLTQSALRAVHDELGIVTEAWSPLGQSVDLTHPAITAIAERLDRTPAQVIIRWHLQIGNVVIPKSVTPTRIEENVDVFDFELSDAEVADIEALDTGNRLGPDPDHFEG